MHIHVHVHTHAACQGSQPGCGFWVQTVRHGALWSPGISTRPEFAPRPSCNQSPDSFPGNSDASEWLFENTSRPKIYKGMISLTFSRWLFAQHADGAKRYQLSHFFFLMDLRLKSIQLSRLTCHPVVKCQETNFCQTPPSASRKYLEMHLKHLLISDIPAVSITPGS